MSRTAFYMQATAEAAVHNMAFGHEFLWNTFGVRPKYGWQVDPFGAAAETAAQFAMLGFQGRCHAARSSWRAKFTGR